MIIKNTLDQNPLLRVLIVFILGILISSFIPTASKMVVLALFASGTGLLLSFVIPIVRFRYELRWVSGFFNLIFWFLLGVLFVGNGQVSVNETIDDVEKQFYYGYVAGLPQKYSNGTKFYYTTKLKDGDTLKSYVEENILVYLNERESSVNLSYGDKIIINTQCRVVRNKGNPMEFDYKSYLNRKGIYRTCFINADDVVICNGKSGNTITRLAYQLRNYLLGLYKKHGFTGQSFGVVSALTLGYREELNEETVSAFKDSGAMHIMAVSGLHVGIIQMMLNFFFSFLIRLKHGKLLRMIIVLSFLWFYAMLTGLTPSVFRAALMFSFIQIGLSLKREISIYNIISASALIVLLINPLQIYDVGFQFSYLAVIGIIYLFPKIYKLIEFKWWIFDKIWGLTVASFSAQLALAPLSIYYFNQFPNYFLLTNIIVIPLAFLIVMTATFLFLSSPLPFVVVIFSFILKKVSLVLIYTAEFVQQLPYSVSSGLYIDTSSLFFWYLLILMSIGYLVHKRVYVLKSILGLVIVFVAYGVFNTYSGYHDSKLVFFNVDRAAAVYCRSGNKAAVLCDTALLADTAKFSYSMGRFLLSERLDNLNLIAINNVQKFQMGNSLFYDDFIFVDEKFKVLIISDERYLNKHYDERLDIDVLYLTNNVKCNLEYLFEIFNFQTVVVDGMNYTSRVKDWEGQCRLIEVEFVSLKRDGAYTMSLPESSRRSFPEPSRRERP